MPITVFLYSYTTITIPISYCFVYNYFTLSWIHDCLSVKEEYRADIMRNWTRFHMGFMQVHTEFHM